MREKGREGKGGKKGRGRGSSLQAIGGGLGGVGAVRDLARRLRPGEGFAAKYTFFLLLSPAVGHAGYHLDLIFQTDFMISITSFRRHR